MSEKGWIRLDRRILDNQMWADKPFSKGQAWIDLLLLTNHTAKKILLGNRSVKVQPGMVITSEAKLSERWGWGRTKTRGFLNWLEADEMIVKKTYSNRTEINIVKWDVYQNPQTTGQAANKQQINSEQTANKQRVNTNNNVNNVNNVNKVDGRGSKAPPPAADRSEKTGTAGAGGITGAEVEEIVKLWNSIEHTANISMVAEGSERFVNLCDCYSLVGAGGITRAVGKIRDSAYLKRKGNIRFDSYMNKNAIVKLLEGAYDEDYGRGGSDGQAVDWVAVANNNR